MRPFVYESPSSAQEATSRGGTDSAFIAGGTTIIDLMKLEVMKPSRLVDLNPLQLRGIEMREDGLRNVLQRTRCGYFRDVNTPCNKREPGSGCPAIDGENRMHAILGTSSSCVATHPSDLAVALVALDASIRIQNGADERLTKLDDFYLVPGDTPDHENQLRPGEIITEVRVPRLQWARRSTYLKIRDRDSYEFALTSAAVALDIDGDRIRDIRIAVGGVGTKPWNLPKVREALAGKPLKQETFATAAKLAVDGANPLRHNGFKVDLVQRTIVRALMNLGDLA